MSKVWIVNASPIIALTKSGHLELLSQLADEIIVPGMVASEVLTGPASDPARQALEGGWGKRVMIEKIPSQVLEWSLGRGESEVIAIALETQGCTVVVDDAQGRRCAQTLGIPLLGTLGVVLLAKKRGHIRSAAEVLRNLQAAGLFLDEDVIKESLRGVAGEDWHS